RSHRMSVLMESLAQGNRDFEIMGSLLEGPIKPWTGETAEEVQKLAERDFKGFEVLQDSRIIDMRPWNSTQLGRSDSGAWVYGYRRGKGPTLAANTDNNTFRIRLLATRPETI